MSILTVKNLNKTFGGLKAIQDVNLELRKNELVGLIGPNGAGKTTLFNLLTGVYRPTSGDVLYEDEGTTVSLVKKSTSQIADMGVTRTFQNIRLFKELTVLDNVLVGLHKSSKAGLLASIIRVPSYFRSEDELKEEALRLLTLFNLEGEKDTLASNLSYGEQRRLEIVRALATRPTILFLDEPAAGMNPLESAELRLLIQRIQKEFELTIVLIEHDMSVVMNVCERIVVLNYGKVLAQGTPKEISENKEVIQAYLGGEV